MLVITYDPCFYKEYFNEVEMRLEFEEVEIYFKGEYFILK